MGTHRISTPPAGHAAASSLLACLCGAALLLTAAMAMAEEAVKQGPASNPPAGTEEPGFFGSIARWFDRQAASFGSNVKDAGSTFQNFGREAGIAAQTTVEGAKGAADAVARIPTARVVNGHEKCALAPNGAPDCLAAANTMCKAKGFATGKSVDMTTAEVCPPRVWMSGRDSGEGCKTETFLSRALCQ